LDDLDVLFSVGCFKVVSIHLSLITRNQAFELVLIQNKKKQSIARNIQNPKLKTFPMIMLSRLKTLGSQLTADFPGRIHFWQFQRIK